MNERALSAAVGETSEGAGRPGGFPPGFHGAREALRACPTSGSTGASHAFGNICHYRKKLTGQEKVMLMLSIFPEILISDFLMALPPVLVIKKKKNFKK